MSQTKDDIIKYEWIDQVEDLEQYNPGGFHPIEIGDRLHDRYRVVDKLGHGGLSTIWLVYDESAEQLVALKVGVASSARARQEHQILRTLSEAQKQSQSLSSKAPRLAQIPIVLDTFEIDGPNGLHPCYTSAVAQGDLRTSASCRLFPIRIARALSAGLVLAVATVHSHGYVHGDIHLGNVLVKEPAGFELTSVEEFLTEYDEPETENIARHDGKPLTTNAPRYAVVPVNLTKNAEDFTLEDAQGILLCDFGEAFSPSTQPRLGEECSVPLPFRPPETFFEPKVPLTFALDIWTLALAIWNIVGMKEMFPSMTSPEGIAAYNVDTLTQEHFPDEWWSKWEDLGSYFYHDELLGYLPATGRQKWLLLEKQFDDCVQDVRKEEPALGVFAEDERDAFLELMRQMLKFRPEERLTAAEVLESEWMVKWALPEFEGTTEKDQPVNVVEPEQPEDVVEIEHSKEDVQVSEENDVDETGSQKEVIEIEQSQEVTELKSLRIKQDETRDLKE